MRDVVKAFRYLGVNIRSEIKLLDYVSLHISSDSEYLKNYIKELMGHINNFIESDLIEDLYLLSKRMSNVKVKMMNPVIDDMVLGIPYVNLWLTYDSLGDSVYTPLLNDELFRKPLENYLKTKMNLDPQIDYWFEEI